MMSSHLTGGYELVNYKFSDQTLKIFTKHIQDSFQEKRILKLDQKATDEMMLEEENKNKDISNKVNSSNQKDKEIIESTMNYQPKFGFGTSLDSITAQ